MKQNSYGELVHTEHDVLDMIMQGIEISNTTIIVDDIPISTIKAINSIVGHVSIRKAEERNIPIAEYDINNQENWHMPNEYKEMDIAKYILTLCNTQDELQRCGHELLMYQERNLFNLLKYLKYLVDAMKENNIIWGVGRGSSVSSYVLYKLEVHKVDSMFYNLDVSEFLR